MPDTHAAIMRLSSAIEAAAAYAATLAPVNSSPVKSAREYKSIRAEYRQAVEDALFDYFTSDGAVTSHRNAMQRAMSDAFLSAYELAYTDGGGELPVESDAMDWLAARQDTEFGYIKELFVTLKDMRAQYRAKEITTADVKAEIERRRDGYSATLDSIYVTGKMFAQQNKMVTWRYGETEHCDTCASLNGKRHKAKWFISRDYIPRKPGANLDCGGYRCQCSLIDDKGKEITL